MGLILENLLRLVQDASQYVAGQNILLIIILNVFMAIASYTDIKSLKIYNKFNIIMLATRIVSIIVLFIMGKMTWIEVGLCFAGAVVMFLLFLIPAMITLDSIGGDIKFAFNIGLWTGLKAALLISLIGSITNFLFRIFFVGEKEKEPFFKVIRGIPVMIRAKRVLPLGPFFYLGYLVILVLGIFVY